MMMVFGAFETIYLDSSLPLVALPFVLSKSTEKNLKSRYQLVSLCLVFGKTICKLVRSGCSTLLVGKNVYYYMLFFDGLYKIIFFWVSLCICLCLKFSSLFLLLHCVLAHILSLLHSLDYTNYKTKGISTLQYP